MKKTQVWCQLVELNLFISQKEIMFLSKEEIRKGEGEKARVNNLIAKLSLYGTQCKGNIKETHSFNNPQNRK